MSPGSKWEKRRPLEHMHVTYPFHPLSSISNNTSFLCIHQVAAIIFSKWCMKVLFVIVDIWQLRMCSSQALSLISWMINQAIFPSMFFCCCFVLFYFVLFFVFVFVFVFDHACLLKKRQSFLSHDKIVKSKRSRNKNQNKGLFWRWNSKCLKIVKATLYHNTVLLCKENASKEQVIFEKRQDFKIWQKQLFC